MFKNYLQIALRNIRRNRLFTGINIFGLTTGLTSSILIFLWVQDELSFDRFVPGADHIVRITATVKDIGTANVPPAFATATKSEMPLVKNATRITSLQKIVTVGARKFDEKRMYYADSNFLRIFGYPLLRGDRTTVLSAPNTVTLTEATAIRYFGGVDQAMGKSIYIDNDIKGSSLQVTGILKDIPENSHLQFDLLLSMDIIGTGRSAIHNPGDISTAMSTFNLPIGRYPMPQPSGRWKDSSIPFGTRPLSILPPSPQRSPFNALPTSISILTIVRTSLVRGISAMSAFS